MTARTTAGETKSQSGSPTILVTTGSIYRSRLEDGDDYRRGKRPIYVGVRQPTLGIHSGGRIDIFCREVGIQPSALLLECVIPFNKQLASIQDPSGQNRREKKTLGYPPDPARFRALPSMSWRSIHLDSTWSSLPTMEAHRVAL